MALIIGGRYLNGLTPPGRNTATLFPMTCCKGRGMIGRRLWRIRAIPSAGARPTPSPSSFRSSKQPSLLPARRGWAGTVRLMSCRIQSMVRIRGRLFFKAAVMKVFITLPGMKRHGRSLRGCAWAIRGLSSPYPRPLPGLSCVLPMWRGAASPLRGEAPAERRRAYRWRRPCGAGLPM